MRIIKALLVLLFLAPTLAAAEPNPDPAFSAFNEMKAVSRSPCRP